VEQSDISAAISLSWNNFIPRFWSSGGLVAKRRKRPSQARRLFVNSLEGVNVSEKWVAGCELGKSTRHRLQLDYAPNSQCMTKFMTGRCFDVITCLAGTQQDCAAVGQSRGLVAVCLCITHSGFLRNAHEKPVCQAAMEVAVGEPSARSCRILISASC